MNHNQRAIEITVELLKKHKVRQIVINPGGTNIAFVNAVQNDPSFKCYSIVDERSAIYFAIGLYLQTGEIVATSCTSAQATRNYIPGLTEAYYKRVPILAITMEKHPRFIGQEYMQAPHQVSLPDDCVKKSYELPFINDVSDEYHSIRLVNEAIIETKMPDPGPVQLCIPWLDFETGNASPDIRKIDLYNTSDRYDFEIENKKILIVVGEHRPFSDAENQSIKKFTEKFNCAVYVNHLSNYHGPFTIQANLGLTNMPVDYFLKDYAPDLIITIGGQTGDYPLYLILSRSEIKAEHWRVSKDGKVIDTYDKLTKVFKMSIEEFFDSFSSPRDNTHSYFDKISYLCTKTKTNQELPLSNAYLAQVLHSQIPKDSIIQFSILNSLRVWNLFPLDPSVECYSNVGAFGIDGGLSTLIGQSVVTDKLAYMVIGDLAFYYDMNSLGIRHIKNNVKIILVNNNGGIEFKLNHNNHTEIDRYTAAANHFKNARGWAETCGFYYIEIKRKEDLIQNKKYLINHFEKPVLMEVFITDKDDYAGYKKIVDANRDLTFSYLMKKGISKIVNR